MNEKIDALDNSILHGAAQTTSQERKLVAEHCVSLAADPNAVSPLDGALADWVDKVARHAYQTLDRDVEALEAAGRSGDEIFELTIAAAYGAARGRYDRALAAIDEAFEA